MSRTSFNELPLDICDRILTLLPDFLSLQHAVLSLKQFCDTFSSRKRSIMRAVVANEVGPALPFAVALVRTRSMIGNRPIQDILQSLNDSDPNSTHWKIDVTGAEAKGLSYVSATVRRLEASFCVLFKDRSATVSTLAEVESFRFHRAMYRLWIISVLLNDTNKRSNPHGLVISFMKNMSEEELVEVHEGIGFLDEMFLSSMRKHNQFEVPNWAHGPRPLVLQLDDLMAQSVENLGPTWHGDHALLHGAITIENDFERRLRDRQVANLYRQKYGGKAILTSPRVEGIQACQKCCRQTPELFGQNNWHFLHCFISMNQLMRHLPGMLSMNSNVIMTMSALYARRDSYAPTLSEMFDLDNDPEGSWKKSDWLCLNCINAFMREKSFTWLVNQLVKNGHQFKENCWYGWNCRTQTHRHEHASKLNHLCEPGARDDTSKTNNNANLNVAQPNLGAGTEEDEDENGSEYDGEDESGTEDEDEDEIETEGED